MALVSEKNREKNEKGGKKTFVFILLLSNEWMNEWLSKFWNTNLTHTHTHIKIKIETIDVYNNVFAFFLDKLQQ